MKEHSEAPIFVVGTPRSGTTLLQVLLDAHPRIAGPPEVHFFHRIYKIRNYFGDLTDDGVLHRVVQELLDPGFPLFEECGFDAERLFNRLLPMERTYRALLNEFMRDFAERRGKARWSEKTPNQSVQDIWDLFPEAQVIHIVRDPRDSVASTLAAPFSSAPLAQLARDWVAFTVATISLGGARGPRHYLRVRYEDLTADPEAVLKIICAFLDEVYDPKMLTRSSRSNAVPARLAHIVGEATDAVRPARRSEYWDMLTSADRARLLGILNIWLPMLGYECVPSAATRLVRASEGLSRPLRRNVGRARTWRQRRISPEAQYEMVKAHMRLVAHRAVGSEEGASTYRAQEPAGKTGAVRHVRSD